MIDKLLVKLRTVLLTASIFLFTGKLQAQMEGSVRDQNDQGIIKASIVATDSTGKVIDTASTDKRGFYRLTKLKPGKYNIEVKAEGFTPAVFKAVEVEKELKMTSDWDHTYYAVRLDITLKTGPPKK